jgi:hypothetical protein
MIRKTIFAVATVAPLSALPRSSPPKLPLEAGARVVGARVVAWVAAITAMAITATGGTATGATASAIWRSDPLAGCGSAAAGCTFATKSLVIDLSQEPRSRVAKSGPVDLRNTLFVVGGKQADRRDD